MAVHWFPLALERVEEIAEYIAEDNPEAAAHWVNELFNTVDRLNDFPISGRVVPETNVRHIRAVIFSAYHVIYSARERIQILTVRHGSQLLSEDALEDET